MESEYFSMDITDEEIATITIDKPPVNALDSSNYVELYNIFYNLSENKKVKVVILTGSGEKFFVAGSDIKEFLHLNTRSGISYTKKNQEVREYIRKFNKPIICAINGLANGGGLALALICDIRIASSKATFALSEINFGILGATQYITKMAHSGVSRKLILSGESINAEDARLSGLVDEIVLPENLMERTISLARKIANKAPLALKYAKQCILKSQETLIDEGLKFEEETLEYLWGTEDKNEGVSAFLEKRKPVFKGK